MSDCGRCWRCLEESGAGLNIFIVCASCGNKRCPKAADHRLDCTGSNDVGQPGSAYDHLYHRLGVLEGLVFPALAVYVNTVLGSTS